MSNLVTDEKVPDDKEVALASRETTQVHPCNSVSSEMRIDFLPVAATQYPIFESTLEHHTNIWETLRGGPNN